VKVISLLALAALIPAAFNPGVAQARMVTVSLCAGDGTARTATIPLGPARPGSGEDGCCAKGCHSGSTRKRGNCHI